MSKTPATLRIERPYATVDAYLQGDAWTVDRTDMLLIGAEPLEGGMAVKFEILLTTGEAVVRGEGRVVEYIAARTGRLGGLRIRFRQLDAPSKSVLRRALEVQKQSPPRAQMASVPDVATAQQAEPLRAVPEIASTPEAAPAPAVAEVASAPEAVRAAAVADVASTPEAAPPPVSDATFPPPDALASDPGAAPAPSERSGVRHRPMGPISAPGDREALLERLRSRAERVAKAAISPPLKRSGAAE